MFPYDAKMSKNTARTFKQSDTLGVKTRMSCRSHDGQPAVLHLCSFWQRLFSPSSFLLAWGAACGPPDACRQMSLVEQNTLCLTSQAATGLWRKLKGSMLCKDHITKARPCVFDLVFLLPSPKPTLSNRTQQGTSQYIDITYVTFGEQ